MTTTTTTTQTCLLPDGRRLAFAEYGDPRGIPVVSLHGTPGGALLGWIRHDTWTRQGLRVITPERPGYGQSDPAPGRTVRSFADDVVTLLDALGLEEVFVTGGSGGGPHALGVGAAVPDRVRAVGVLVGAAPLLPEEVSQQVDVNRRIHAALGDMEGLRAVVGPVRDAFVEQGIEAVMQDAPESDKVQWATVAEAMNAAMGAALAPGIEGMVDDFVALWGTPWGFDPADVAVPVLWASGADDMNVPLAAALRVVDRLPDCRLLVWDSVGHAPTPDLQAEFLTGLLARAL